MTIPRLPMCYTCAWRRARTLTCKAYPKGIPDAIIDSEHDHRLPYPGDGGVLYKRQARAVEPLATPEAIFDRR